MNETCRGEIAHVHAIDGSFHMSLHLDDVKELLEKGWGQRHPLAGRGPGVMFGQSGNTAVGRRLRRWARLLGWKGRDGEGRAIVPNGFMLLYAPRNEKELKTITKIVEAGAWWVTGKEIELASETQHVGEIGLATLRGEAGVTEDDRVPGAL